MAHNLKLTLEQEEALTNLVEDREGCMALLYLIDQMVIGIELTSLKSPIVQGQESKFIYEKLQAEGARKLYTLIRSQLLKKPENSL